MYVGAVRKVGRSVSCFLVWSLSEWDGCARCLLDGADRGGRKEQEDKNRRTVHAELRSELICSRVFCTKLSDILLVKERYLQGREHRVCEANRHEAGFYA